MEDRIRSKRFTRDLQGLRKDLWGLLGAYKGLIEIYKVTHLTPGSNCKAAAQDCKNVGPRP